MTALPGFVDLQVNGHRNVDFSDPRATLDDFVRASRRLNSEGTAAFLPTIVTASLVAYERNLDLLGQLCSMKEFEGRLLGIHMEGPFISPREGAVGAHNPKWVQKPSVRQFKQMQTWAHGKVKFLTVAAEIPGADRLVRYAAEAGVTVSLGHELASAADLKRLVAAGARALTHLGNGIPHMINRHVNPIWAGLANDDLTAMLITDSHHLPGDVVKAMIRAKGADKVVVTSDASYLAGMPPGPYRDVVLERSGLLRMAKPGGYLAGSSSIMMQCMNFLASLGFLDEEQLLKIGFYNPCRLIGVDPRKVRSDYTVALNRRTGRFAICR